MKERKMYELKMMPQIAAASNSNMYSDSNAVGNIGCNENNSSSDAAGNGSDSSNSSNSNGAQTSGANTSSETGELPKYSPEDIQATIARIFGRKPAELDEVDDSSQTPILRPAAESDAAVDSLPLSIPSPAVESNAVNDSSQLLTLYKQDQESLVTLDSIKATLEKFGKCQSDLAVSLGVSRFYVSKLLHGAKPLTVDLQRRCVRVFESWGACSIDDHRVAS